MLVYAYFSTGQISFRAERILFALAGKGVPLTIAMHRSLVVLLGHLAWVAVGSFILWAVPTPRPFFGGWKGNGEKSGVMNKEGNETPVLSSSSSSEVRPYHWYNLRWNDKWLWPTLGGYFISAWFFNIADFINQLVLPVEVFQMAGEGVVAQLINPENNDIAASLVGYVFAVYHVSITFKKRIIDILLIILSRFRNASCVYTITNIHLYVFPRLGLQLYCALHFSSLVGRRYEDIYTITFFMQPCRMCSHIYLSIFILKFSIEDFYSLPFAFRWNSGRLSLCPVLSSLHIMSLLPEPFHLPYSVGRGVWFTPRAIICS